MAKKQHRVFRIYPKVFFPCVYVHCPYDKQLIQSSPRKIHELAKPKTYCLINTKNLVKKLGDIPALSS